MKAAKYFHNNFRLVHHGPVAQWIRHLTTNQGIPGSSPGRVENFRSIFALMMQASCYQTFFLTGRAVTQYSTSILISNVILFFSMYILCSSYGCSFYNIKNFDCKSNIGDGIKIFEISIT